jgi:DNA-binding NtrC family response regulator
MKGTLCECSKILSEEDLREGEPKMNPVWKKSGPSESNLEKHRMILIVSACLEDRRTLVRIFEELNLNVLICSSLAHATEALDHHAVALIFCDEKLPDGTYRDLLAQRNLGRKIPPVVLAMRDGDWEGYLEAIRRGAFDAIRRPFTPTDVELTLIHAVRVEDQGAAYHVAAGAS